MTPAISPTRDIKSLGIILIYLLVPLFITSVLVYWTVSFIGSLGLIQLLGPTNSTWGQEYLSFIKTMIGHLDTVMLLIYGILVGRLTVQSFRTDIHPIYGIIGLFSVPLLIYMTGFGANIIAIFTNLEFLQTASNQFTYTYTFFQNAPAITGWTAIFILLVMIGTGIIKRRRTPGGAL